MRCLRPWQATPGHAAYAHCYLAIGLVRGAEAVALSAEGPVLTQWVGTVPVALVIDEVLSFPNEKEITVVSAAIQNTVKSKTAIRDSHLTLRR